LIIFQGVYDQDTEQLTWEKKQRITLKSPFYRQVEALTWVNSRKILIGNEQRDLFFFTKDMMGNFVNKASFQPSLLLVNHDMQSR
jgi:hypothetical protein